MESRVPVNVYKLSHNVVTEETAGEFVMSRTESTRGSRGRNLMIFSVSFLGLSCFFGGYLHSQYADLMWLGHNFSVSYAKEF